MAREDGMGGGLPKKKEKKLGDVTRCNGWETFRYVTRCNGMAQEKRQVQPELLQRQNGVDLALSPINQVRKKLRLQRKS